MGRPLAAARGARLSLPLPPLLALCLVVVAAVAGACRSLPPPPNEAAADLAAAPPYVVGPLDQLRVFVWRAQDLSADVPVRPDGRISLPLVGDIQAAGRTTGELSQAIQEGLRAYVQNPVVTVIVTSFGNAAGQTVRVVGEASAPAAVPYRAGMSVLDVMVAAGGLGEFAAGNDAVLIRGSGTGKRVYGLRLDDLLNRGDVAANSPVLPGDVILVPKGFF